MSAKDVIMDIIFIDLDNTICDYAGGYAAYKDKHPETLHPQSMEDFWTGLKPIDDAVEVVNDLRCKYEVYLLSSPSARNPASYSGKRKWVELYFDYQMCERLILCRNKGLLNGDFLIDDLISGAGQENFEGYLIQFGSPEYSDWCTVGSALR